MTDGAFSSRNVLAFTLFSFFRLIVASATIEFIFFVFCIINANLVFCSTKESFRTRGVVWLVPRTVITKYIPPSLLNVRHRSCGYQHEFESYPILLIYVLSMKSALCSILVLRRRHFINIYR